MKRLQNGEMVPVGDATVLKGQRSMRSMVSSLVRLAPTKFAFRRDVMFGVKMSAQIPWAAFLILDSGPSSKLVQRPWSRVLLLPSSSLITTML